MMELMTLNEVSDIVHKICTETDGAVCLECINCRDKLLFFEGDVKYLYDKKYVKGCIKCGREYKIYGYNGIGIEL
jgi:hypothetical protein